ncbi:MAG: MFS transporter [Firmicutes bacterium]|nr:MFS transporter [Bacillota bacterium]
MGEAIVKEKKPFFYGWFIIVCCCVIILIDYGVGYNILTAFTIPICESTGISREQYGIMYTLMTVGQIITSINASKIMKKMGVLNMIRAGAVLFILVTWYSAHVTKAWQLWLIGLLYGPTFVTGGFFALSIIIANWFKEKRGMATGLVFMSSGLGTVFMLPLATRWIESMGWQTAKLYFAAISLVMIPVCFFFLKEKPEDMGLKPYGEGTAAEKPPAEEDLWGYDRPELVRMPGAWVFLMFIMGVNFAGSLGSITVPYLRDLGYEASAAARIQSLNMLSLAIGRTTTGLVSDRFSVEKSGAFCIALSPMVFLGAMLARDYSWGIIIMILGYGITMSVNSVFVTLLTGKIFGRKHFASVYGLFSGAGAMMGACSPLIYGRIFAVTGSYYPALKLYFFILICGALCYFTAARITPKKNA